MLNPKIKIAIVYDWIDKWGGVERILLHLHTLFPHAIFYTSAVEYKNAQWAKTLSVRSSFIQTLPLFLRSNRQLMAPLFPAAFESFQFDEFDLVISLTSAFAKGIITKPHTKHLCYILTPPRYLWSHQAEYLGGIKGLVTRPLITHLKEWDTVASHRPDSIVSISKTTAERVHKYYGITSPVIYPPFDTDYWDKVLKLNTPPQGVKLSSPYFLWVGRMEKYKKPEMLIEAAKRMQSSNFIFVGTGNREARLKKIAPPNCQFTGVVSDEQLAYLYRHAQALIMPQNEDFGYVSLESQYCGCPVIAFKEGGASETVIDGKSGLFFNEQTVASLVSKLERCSQISYNLRHSLEGMQESLKKTYGIHRFNEQFVYQLQHNITI